MAWIIPTVPKSTASECTQARKFPVAETVTAKIATVIAVMNAALTEASAAGLRNSHRNSEGDCNDGCRHQQLASHGSGPFHLRHPISPSDSWYMYRRSIGLPCKNQIAELLEYGAGFERLKRDDPRVDATGQN
jgi:hypothetical protein